MTLRVASLQRTGPYPFRLSAFGLRSSDFTAGALPDTPARPDTVRAAPHFSRASALSPASDRLRAGPLRRRHRLGKPARFGVGRRQRAYHDGPFEPGQFARPLAEPDRLGAVAHPGLGAGRQQPGEVVEDVRRLGLEGQRGAITLEAHSNFPCPAQAPATCARISAEGQQVQRLAQIRRRELRFRRLGQNRRQVFGGRRIIGLQLPGQGVLGHSSAPFPRQKNMPKISMRASMTRVPPQQGLELGLGLIRFPLLGEETPEIVEGIVVSGIELEGGAEMFSRFVHLSLLRQRSPEIIMRQPIAGGDFERMAEKAHPSFANA